MADPIALSARLVRSAGRPDSEAWRELAALDANTLARSLQNDDLRIAFWLNVYNGAVRARIRSNPRAYRRRLRFFAAPAVVVAGRKLSLNAIEHGILRRSALLVGLGYVHNPFPGRFERLMRVSRLDPRIHFALNCGARSCPPVATWDPATLDQDLERATDAYLKSETRVDDRRGMLVPRLLSWYRGDFGGRVGIRSLLVRHGLDVTDADFRFGPYDWTLDA